MSATHGALRPIELAAARLCREVAASIGPSPAGGALPAGIATLRLWQAAWTRALYESGAPVALGQIADLAAGLPRSVLTDASALPGGSAFPPAAARALCNLLLLAGQALPQGGVVALAGSAQDLFVRIDGPGAAWPPGIGLFAADRAAAEAGLMQEATHQAALAALVARDAGIRLSLLLPPAGSALPPVLRLGGA